MIGWLLTIITAITAVLTVLIVPAVSIVPLLGGQLHVRLAFTNQALSGGRFWLVFVYFIGTSIARRVGFGKTPHIDSNGAYHKLIAPDVSVVMPFACSTADIEQYRRTCGSEPLSHTHLPLFLSAMTEPAMLLLLAHRLCPFDPVGSVNVRNRFEVTNPTECVVFIRGVTDKTEQLEIVAHLDRNLAMSKRGWEFKIIVELVAGDRVLFRQTFTTLVFCKHRGHLAPSMQPEIDDKSGRTSYFHIADRDPLSWASLSRDYNPIHTSALVARLLGFRSKIAHGNHVAALALTAAGGLEEKQTHEENVAWMEVEMKRPVFIPTALDVVKTNKDGVVQHRISCKDKDVVLVRHKV